MEQEHPLRVWRSTARMGQDVMANRLGVTTATVSRLETGKQTASLPLAYRVAALTGGAVQPFDLIREVDKWIA